MFRNVTTIRLPEVDSTSDEAKRILTEGRATTPLVVLADRQTAGRGRRGRTWWSDQGSLTVTVAVDPATIGLPAERWPALALAAAVAVVDALEPPLLRGTVGIRWPNDVEASDRKLAGLLPEILETTAGPRLLLGIGLNVAVDFERAPAEVRDLAVSLHELLGWSMDRDELLGRLLDRLEGALQRLADNDPGLSTRWAELDRLRGRDVAIAQAEAVIRGIARGITPAGRLLVEVDGRCREIAGGQVLR